MRKRTRATPKNPSKVALLTPAKVGSRSGPRQRRPEGCASWGGQLTVPGLCNKPGHQPYYQRHDERPEQQPHQHAEHTTSHYAAAHYPFYEAEALCVSRETPHG
jgi:hypothetical protein